MSNKYIGVIVAILIIAGGIYFFKNQNSISTPKTSTPSPAQNQNPVTQPAPTPVLNQVIRNVNITGFAFSPASLTVRKGETIVWTNKDPAPHTVTGGDLKSNALGQNETYSFTYDKTGSFSYYCSLHPSMKGTITVTN